MTLKAVPGLFLFVFFNLRSVWNMSEGGQNKIFPFKKLHGLQQLVTNQQGMKDAVRDLEEENYPEQVQAQKASRQKVTISVGRARDNQPFLLL